MGPKENSHASGRWGSCFVGSGLGISDSGLCLSGVWAGV